MKLAVANAIADVKNNFDKLCQESLEGEAEDKDSRLGQLFNLILDACKALSGCDKKSGVAFVQSLVDIDKDKVSVDQLDKANSYMPTLYRH